jgi:hypothetical protein
MKLLTGVEKARKVGPNKDIWSWVTKYSTNFRFICNFLTKIVTTMGKLEAVVTLSALDSMLLLFADIVLGKEIDVQKQWTSVVRKLRRKEFVKTWKTL